MKMDAMRRQGARTDLSSESTSNQNDWKLETADIISEQVGASKAQVRRYVRLTELIPEPLDYVDKKRIQFTVAVDISYIDKEIQKWLFEYIKENGVVKPKQIAALKEACTTGIMTQAKMISILNENLPWKASAAKNIISDKKIRGYFPDNTTADEMRSVIYGLLEQWKNGRE